MLKLNLKQRWLNLTIEQQVLLFWTIFLFIGSFVFLGFLQQFNIPSSVETFLPPAEQVNYNILSIFFLGSFLSAIFHLGRLWQTRRK